MQTNASGDVTLANEAAKPPARWWRVLAPLGLVAGVALQLVALPVRLAFGLVAPLVRPWGPWFARAWVATVGFFGNPIQVAALACFVFAFGLAAVWAGLGLALEGEARPSPIELAELTDRHRALFLWTGVLWFAIHSIAIWVILGLFLVHADRQRPTLWVFTVLCSLAIICWALFGALSIPLGASTGPQYSDAMDRANLSPDETILWTAKCRPDDSVSAATGIPVEDLKHSCVAAWDEPLLLMHEPSRAALSERQLMHLSEAWTAAQDGWLVRKLSDTLYFAGNALFLCSMFFFSGTALTSRVIRTFSVTWGAIVGLLFALGFTAFWTDAGVLLNVLAICAQGLLLVFIGTDLWGRRSDYHFSQVRPDRRPVRLLRIDSPVNARDIKWVYDQPDEWYRNRQITNTYARLAYQLGLTTHHLPAGRVGDCFPERPRPDNKGAFDPGTWFDNANWYHFGVWASHSAGERIWRSDLSSGTTSSLERTFEEVVDFGTGKGRLAKALADGNQKVFCHVGAIGQAFVDHFRDLPRRNERSWKAFEAEVRGWADTDRWRTDDASADILLPAFRHYYEARFADGEERARLILLANLIIVSYEQQVLDPLVKDAAGNGLRLLLVFIYPSSLFRALTWGGVCTTYPIWRTLRSIRRMPRKSLSKFGTEQEEWALRFWARGFYSAARLVFGQEIDSVTASQIKLTIGSEEGMERLVVGRNLGSPRGGILPVSIHESDAGFDEWPWVRGDRADAIRVANYTVLADRLRYITVLFQRWQRSKVLQQEPFTAQQRARERMTLVSTIEPNFDSGIRAPVGEWAALGPVAATGGVQ